MKAVEVINRAYILSGIVARDLDSVQGSEGEDGIFWLNQLLSEQSITGDQLPYYGHLSFNSVNGQKQYFVSGLITIDTITFNIGSIRYSIRGENRRTYWGESRAEDVESLPYAFYYERVNGGMNIYFYFTPSGITNFTATGLVSIPQVTNDTELNNIVDAFYQSYLMFLLAERLCQWKKISLPPATQIQLDKFRRNLFNLNPKDFTLSYRSLLGLRGYINYAQANIGKGWTSP